MCIDNIEFMYVQVALKGLYLQTVYRCYWNNNIILYRLLYYSIISDIF